MKIIATIINTGQVGMDEYRDFKNSYIFDSSDNIDHMFKITKVNRIENLNLSHIDESKGEGKL